MNIVILFVGLIVATGVYVRLAPSDEARWHVPVTATSGADMEGGAIRVIDGDTDTLARADAVMQSLDRTRVLAGSVDEGRITYVTRSRLWGFPDYTTLELADGQLRMFARLRFGRSDLGVNAERLRQVLAALEG